MPNDNTARGYPLPHPDNIASSDVLRIRSAMESVDTDIQRIWDVRAKDSLETFINLWS